MISCEQAATICNKKQYKEATLLERLRLSFHVISCKTCQKHSKRNTQFTTLCEKANLHVLSESEKEAMKRELQNEIHP
jgi:hypothetical protein